MKKFNEMAQSVLGEAQIDPKLGSIYKQIGDLLSKKGLKSHEYDDVMKAVQEAMKFSFNQGYKFAEKNPFR